MKDRNKGFTLIELMVVVVILAILFGIAIPSYRDYMQKAARAQAKAKILDLMQAEERYFTNHGTYVDSSGFTSSPAVPTGWGDFAFSGGDYSSRKYDISVAAGATGSIATSFTITATPANGFTDALCQNLIAESNGTKSASSGATSCW